jgi:hypothetical protein
VPLTLGAHDARADAVDLLLAAVRAVVVAFDDVLVLGLRAHRQRQDLRRIRLVGHRLQFELDLLADRDPALLQHRLQRAGDLLGIGRGHADIGQHLLDRVAFLEAQGELVAIGRRRLGIGRLLGLLARLSGRLAGLEPLEVVGIETLEVGGADRRRQGVRIRQDHRRFGHLGCRIGRRRGAAPVEEDQGAQRQADGTDGENDRPEQREQRRFGAFGPARRRGGNPS